jgi:hypothetical protein
MYQSIQYYIRWYQNYFLDCWADLGPSEYGTLLIAIGVFGWLLMKSSNKI